MRILVLGYIVRGPIGGLSWHYLQYVIGLHNLGHEVFYIEESGDYPMCYDPEQNVTGTDPSYGLRFTKDTFHSIGLGDHWAFYDVSTDHWAGPGASRVHDFLDSADLLLNISGLNYLRPWLAHIPHRVLIDTDPVFTQIRHLTEPDASSLAEQHTAYFTFGENIGSPSCSIPDDGFAWQPTRQPIVLDAWPVTLPPGTGRFTTVMQWDSYAKCTYANRTFGMKSDSFKPYFELPAKIDSELELALGSANAPREKLSNLGWHLRDPLEVTRDLWSYQDYIRGSKGEFSIAKHGYVVSNSGWFSERSACYLASGRPVVVQETGFSQWMDACGLGVVPFSSLDEAGSAIEEVTAQHQKHAEMAREIAREYFAANRVLGKLVEEALAA